MIAKEGLIFIFIGLAITAGLWFPAIKYDSRILFSLTIVFAILTLFTTFFFRDPERTFEHRENILISPADGKVLSVEELDHHEFIGGPAKKVSIFLSVFDVHINRIPADGVIDFVKYNPGKFFAAWEDKASHLNEQTEIGMTSKSGHKVIFKQIAGLIARRIICKLEKGNNVTAGDRFGLIRFGSRTELFVPADSKIEIKPGQHIAGGETVIGYLPAGQITRESDTEKEENDSL